ncbi:MAG: hypothetical protein O9302_00385 [Cyclobacteriaceae bacterium]|jgi:hypothetical protein|nr:hypothetical protein [Cytophagales bacterium]MCZ8326488.1 hypothetical protein [Cyclobacteriaceae bacterium]
MIGIKIGTQFLKLKPGTSINLVKKNQIFNDGDLIKGDYSLSFEAPGGDECPENAALLGNADVIPLNNLNKEIDAELFILDTFYDKGKLLVKTISANSYRLAFAFGIATISDDFKNIKIRTILGNQLRTIHARYSFKKIYIKPIGSSPFRIKVNGEEIEAISVGDLRFQINNKLEQTQQLIALESTVGQTTPRGIAHPYVVITKLGTRVEDELYVEPIEETEAAKAQWYIEGENETDYYSDINTFITPYLTATPTDQAIRFPFVLNDRTYGIDNPQNNKGCNVYFNSLFSLNSCNWGAENNKPFEVRNTNTLHPFLRVKYMLDQIAQYFNTKIEGDFYNDVTTGKRLIWNSMPASFAQKYIGSRPYIFFKRSFKLAELVPDVTAIDFLKALQNRYNLAVYLNEKNGNIVMRYREPVFESSSYKDITMSSSPIDEIEDENLKGLLLKAVDDNNDIYAADEEINIGLSEELKIEAKCGASKNDRSEIPLTGGQTLSGAVFGHPINKSFTLRIFYDKGWIATGGYFYNASSWRCDDFEESFFGVNGIYQTLYKRTIRARLKRRTISLSTQFFLREILSLTREQKLRNSEVMYLWEEISMKISDDGLEACDVKLYTD